MKRPHFHLHRSAVAVLPECCDWFDCDIPARRVFMEIYYNSPKGNLHLWNAANFTLSL